MFEIFVCLGILIFWGLCLAIGIAAGGALWGLGLWGIWHILCACGVAIAAPMWWPCFGIGCILTVLFGIRIKINY